jgi:RNA polymerase primary sigma factor
MKRAIAMRDMEITGTEAVTGSHRPRHPKPDATRRRKEMKRAATSDLVEVDSHLVGGLLSEFAPMDAEPIDLPDGVMPAKLRAARKTAQPHADERDDLRSSVYVFGGRQALLTPSQEISLARRVEHGDPRAKDTLINSNLRLVNSIAQRYQGRGVPMEDLMQEGVIGLIRAADKYNWRRGFRFSTYATHWIRQTILRAIANTGRNIRLPAYVVDTLGRVARVRSELENTLGRTPTRAELAQAAGMTEARLLELLQSASDPISLDAPMGEDQGARTLADIVPAAENQSPSSHLFVRAVQDEISRALQTLPPREQQVLRLRFGLEGHEPHTLEEIGKVLHITRERARQLEAQSLEKLRQSNAAIDLRATLESA